MSDPIPPDEPHPTPPPGSESEAAPRPDADAEADEGFVEVAVVGPAEAYEAIDTILIPYPGEEGEQPFPREPIAPGEGGEPGVSITEAIERLGVDLGGKLDRLQGVVDRELRAESSREKVVDRLHAELQEYKSDLLLKVTRPIFIDLIQLHDDMGKMADSLEGERASGLLREFQQGIEDVLYRQGVEPYRVEGDGFDPRRQRAVSTVNADEPALNKTIAARLRPGFASGEKVIRPELVSVFSTRKPPADGSGPGGAEA
ncbi:nucleotide exchange factor GrpE [Tautonia plasticadhaerens]|uniref:Protein GrpE n=1 Tax=Tautonia plasticadhaerens TaxID=2527974 RepID=A0A518H8Q0_9BACT|nr:nucleotide exchange factor GrpE [Tautonia plasticadhaerens]QDV37214.1 Protein GrpE [Tautonia plasticadhaerens]